MYIRTSKSECGITLDNMILPSKAVLKIKIDVFEKLEVHFLEEIE
jgi:hypothetical protein